MDERTNNLKFKSDVVLSQVRTNLGTIASYIFLIWLWQFTLSFQSSMYGLMNTAVFGMFMFGAIGTIFAREEQETIIKHTKSQLIYYLVVTFCYDMFLKVIVNDMLMSAQLGEVDPALLTAKQFLMVTSTMIKIGFPIAYVIWMVQKLAIFRSGFSKKRQIEILRDIRDNKIDKLGQNSRQEINIDRY